MRERMQLLTFFLKKVLGHAGSIESLASFFGYITKYRLADCIKFFTVNFWKFFTRKLRPLYNCLNDNYFL